MYTMFSQKNVSGSDLDGDEYAVFWDSEIMFRENEEPAYYNSKMSPQITDSVQVCC